ncbi:hybrid sensor histidine kinase/response regulator transcription factor [Wenzhouxiangella marina]|uniref:histidine kinase n=1 Tax=Wenzhouxiangella marina TaxID=1579979 RepID=A0A0K0XZT6_9GAMM|nr:hybrid sensor histidine kinase/response regulator transcription factor [Wenzhouxiangella marina]AKS43185.1 hypothetical protein WM2015_2828 [Wenzhouxiangella marina]MBB6087130.1 signal transduction histidine kinase/AraC-like DNA-binding protein/streptogramin lyase [Wenzhouxiangella marina]
MDVQGTGWRLLTAMAGLLAAGLAVAEIRFERLSMGDGLAQSSISSMLQDRDGYLWFGTQFGLSRYDGYRFETHRHRTGDPDSLSHGFVLDLHLSFDGRIWVATPLGLNRMDPRTGRVERFVLAAGAPAGSAEEVDRINEILGESGSGDLFVSVGDAHRPAVLRAGRQTLEPLEFSLPLTELGLRRSSGLVDSADRLWVINDAGLWWQPPGDGVLQLVEGVTPRRFRAHYSSLAESADGLIVVNAEEGVSLIDPASAEVVERLRPSEYGREDDRVDALVTTSDGSIWIAMDASFARYQPSLDEWQWIYSAPPEASGRSLPMSLTVAERGEGDYWFANQYGVAHWLAGRDGVRIFMHTPGEDDSLPPTLRTSPYYVFADRDRTLWVGSQLGGVARLPINAQRFDHIVDQSRPGELPFAGQNVVRGVAETLVGGREQVWVALDTAGLRQYERGADGTYSLQQAYHAEAEEPWRLPSDRTWSVAVDPLTMNVWVGLDGRMVVIDPRSGEIIRRLLPGPAEGLGRIQSLLFSDDGERLWIGHAAVEEFHLSSDRLSLEACPNGSYLPDRGLHNLIELPDGRLIVAGREGFSEVDFHSGRDAMTVFSRRHRLGEGQEIFGLAVDPERGFWIGTRQSGLAQVWFETGSSTPQIRWFGAEDGLVDETIYAILPEASGRLWLSSNQGLMRLDPANGDVRHFTPPDGVQHFEFNNTVAHLGASGRFYFGGINGVNAFVPEQIHMLADPPRLRLSELRVNGQARSVAASLPAVIELSHDENDLEASFVGLHSAAPSRHRYQHWLEGLDEDWREVGFQRQVRYGGLAPGTYRLIVRAANSDGVWSDDAVLLEATIKPPPWATGWAYLSYVLIALLTLGGMWFQGQRRRRLLEAEVRQRTSELTEKQALIRRQARDLERALAARTEFFANVSHEFRTPLSLIQASLEELEARDRQSPVLSRARLYLDRLVRLVDQLLDLSALQAGAPMPAEAPWSLSRVLELMVGSFRPLAEEKGLQFSADLQADCITCCPRHHVEQIALNLISNAIKYSPKGASVQVLLRAGEDDGLLELCVVDTGPGIAEDEQQAIFERFHRAPDAYISGQAGAGIGLALVRESIEAMGGSIDLESRPGAGSRFTARLPGEQRPDLPLEPSETDTKPYDLEASQLALSSARHEEGSDRPAPTEGGSEATVLVVEDQADLRAYLVDVLKRDWRVLEAPHGERGLELARLEVPDLIVSDVMMPRMDGFQLLRSLRGDLATSHIPVLLLTARHDRDSRLRGIMLSADDFMGKPFSADELRLRLKRMQDNRLRLQRFLLERSPEPVGGPDELGAPDLGERDRELLARMDAWLGEHLEDEVSVEAMASLLSLEVRTLQRKLKALTGQRPSEYIRHFRLQHAMNLLLNTERSVNDIALSCGFSSAQSFSRSFSRQYGEPPDRWRRARQQLSQGSGHPAD